MNKAGVIAFWAILKIINLFLFLIYRSKRFTLLKDVLYWKDFTKLMEHLKNTNKASLCNLYNIKAFQQSNECTLYTFLCYINEEILHCFYNVRGKETLRQFYVFLYNIPGSFVTYIDYKKLLICIIDFINIYLKNRVNLTWFSIEFMYNISKLCFAIFANFLVKVNFKIWLNFYNFEGSRNYITNEHLDFFKFDEKYRRRKNSNGYKEDYIYIELLSYDQKNETFINELKRNLFEKGLLKSEVENMTFVNKMDNSNNACIREEYSDSVDKTNEEEYNTRQRVTSEFQILNNIYIEINKEYYNDIKTAFSRNWEFFFRILFHSCYNNYKVLSNIKTFFYFAFYNKLYFHELGGCETWEQIYNCLYLGIFNSKKKKNYDILLAILNILLCMYNSYACYNKIDRTMHIELNIMETESKSCDLPYIIKNKRTTKNEWQSLGLYNSDDEDIISDLEIEVDGKPFTMEENYVSEFINTQVYWNCKKTYPLLRSHFHNIKNDIRIVNFSDTCIFSYFLKIKHCRLFTLPDFLMNNLDLAYKNTYPELFL